MKKTSAGHTRHFSIITAGLSYILSFSLLFCCPLTARAEWYSDDENDHGAVPYSELQYSGYDEKNMLDALQAMEDLSTTPGNDSAMLENYHIMQQEYNRLVTQHSLNNLRYYNDVNNTEYQNVDKELSRLGVDTSDRTGHTMHVVLTSGYYQLIADEIGNPDLVQFYLDYQDLTEEQKNLVEEENDLVQQYDRASSREFTYTDSDGKIWNPASLDTDQSLYTIPGKYHEVSIGLAKARNDELAPIFVSLVRNRNRQAQLKGFKNYAEYAYKNIYARDYSPEDSKKLYAAVKEHFVPANSTVYINAISTLDQGLFDMPEQDEDAMVEAVGKYIGKIDPELLEAYDYMRRYHLYDMKSSPTKMQIGYTDYLYEYREPIIFNCPTHDYNDYRTLIHEFGHYNDFYHNAKSCFTDLHNTDVSEIYSQGMELLYLKYADKLYKGMGDSYRLLCLYNITDAVVSGCIYDEFQNIAYASEKDLSVEELNDIFCNLSKEYGFSDDFSEVKGYSWVDVSHTFQSPMYYISYATSALSALDIFTSSLDDRQKAIDLYMSLTTYGLSTPYCELIETVGLRDVFDENTVKEIAASSANYSRDITKHMASVKSYKFLAKTMGVLVLAVAVIAVLVILVDLWLKKRSAGENETPPDEPQA